jgi:hypothetical protein
MIATNLPDLDDEEQQTIGRDLLLMLFYGGNRVDGIRIEFEDE